MDADTARIEPQDPYAEFSTPVRLAPPWDYIEIGQWKPIAVTSGPAPMVYLAREARSADQLWVRFEFRTSTDGVRSSRAHWQADCEGWRSQLLSYVAFRGPNLTDPIESLGPTYSWEFAAPDTVADRLLRWHCSPEAVPPPPPGFRLERQAPAPVE